MGYDGRGLGVNGKGIISPIKVKERPRYEGLGYGHGEIGECSKIVEAKKSSSDDISRHDGSDDGKLSSKKDECSKRHTEFNSHH